MAFFNQYAFIPQQQECKNQICTVKKLNYMGFVCEIAKLVKEYTPLPNIIAKRTITAKKSVKPNLKRIK